MTEDLEPHELVPPALADLIDGIPTAVVIAIEYVDADGTPMLFHWWDDSSPWWTRVGIAERLVEQMTPIRMRMTDD